MAFHLTDQAMGGQGDDDQPLGQQSSEGNDVHDTTMTNSSGCSEVATSPSPPLSEGAPAKEVRKNNVSELVAKSKKAASSLWTLLHAKNCRMGVNRCSHAGCAEAKLMYLHLKTCSAELLEPCPSSHPGCQDSRKLLAHYRRCRDIRARQAQNPAAKSQHHVCTFEDHALFMLYCNLTTTLVLKFLRCAPCSYRTSSPRKAWFALLLLDMRNLLSIANVSVPRQEPVATTSLL
mmetsp:Transcript_25700/g.47897  ORF Transcript_25700/g.47897 Transcript_25700/m.47897 type:complete len:233 (+) Transcript_25700:350-1048(+)